MSEVEGAEPERSRAEPLGPASVALALSTVLLWSGTAVGNRYVLDVLPPIAVGGLRFALAVLFMVGWCRWIGAPLILSRRGMGAAFLLATLLFLQIATFNIGLAWSNSSHAVLLVNTFIFWVAAIEHFVTKTHRLSWQQTAGLLIAASGAVALLTGGSNGAESANGDLPDLAGDLLLAVSGLVLGIKVICTKQAVRVAEPASLILWHDIFAVALFAVFSAALEDPQWSAMTWEAFVALMFIGLAVSGFCFGMQAYLLRRHSASQISVFSFLTPIVGVLLAVVLRGDPLSIWLLISGAAVTTGIWIVNRD